MQIATFIKLENTFEAAMSVNESPQVYFYDYGGVHLVTSSEYRYVQRTYANDGIEIEDYVIEFFDMCGDKLSSTGIDDDTFTVIRNFDDPDTGLPQIEWQLDPSNLDYGDQLIYFRITSGANGYVYSSPFKLTDTNKNFVTEFWYKSRKNDNMLSIGLDMYRRNKKAAKSLKNYDPASSGYQITGAISISPFERFLTTVINMDIMEMFSTIFLNGYIYSKPIAYNELPIKTGLYEVIESEDPQADENFASYEVLLTRNYNFTYDPNAVIVVPEPPPVDPPFITLSSVIGLNSTQVSYTFTIGNFTPDYLTYQFSLNGTTWVSSTGDVNSPHAVTVLNYETNNYFFRIIHPQATSNVVQILQKGITLDSVIKTGIKSFRLGYTENNYIATAKLVFEFSPDDINYRPAFYPDGNDNPKDVDIPEEFATEPYFRIKDNEFGITSNVIQYIP